MSALFWISFYAIVGYALALTLVSIIYAALYDLRSITRKKRQQYEPDTNTHSPSLTILIPAYNEAAVIERCLVSAAALRYENLRIVVVNDSSTDKTQEIVERFLAAHDYKHMSLISTPTNRGKGEALQYALGHSVDSELLMVLDADCVVSSQSLARAVSYFTDPLVSGVAMHVRISANWSPFQLFQKIEFIIGHRQKKYYAAANSEFIVSGQGSIYRTDVLRTIGGFRGGMLTEDVDVSLRVAALGNKRHVLAYAADAPILTEAVPNLKSLFRQRYRWKFGTMQAIFTHPGLIFSLNRKHTKTLTWIHIPQVLLGELLLPFELFILAAFGFIAFTHANPAVFIGSILASSIYNCAMIAIDEVEPVATRWLLCVLVILFYPLFLAMTLLNCVALAQCAVNWRQLFGKKAVSGSWVPPDRPGLETI